MKRDVFIGEGGDYSKRNYDGGEIAEGSMDTINSWQKSAYTSGKQSAPPVLAYQLPKGMEFTRNGETQHKIAKLGKVMILDTEEYLGKCEPRLRWE